MIYRNLSIFVAIAIVVSGCGDSSDSMKATSHATAESTCLQQHEDSLDTLLTMQSIAPYLNGDAEEVEVEYDTEYAHQLSYSWPSDRTRAVSVGSRKMQVPTANVISLGRLNTYTENDYYQKDNNDPVKVFQRFNHNMTAKERARAREALGKALDGQDKATKEIGKAMVGTTTSPTIRYETIDGVGDAAAWDVKAERLNVLTGATTFAVRVSISADVKDNQAAAKTLAKSILANCATGN